MSARDVFERVTRRAYRALLLAYPTAFRDDVGQDMEETFADELRAARMQGRGATARCLAGATADALTNGIRERFQPQPYRATMFYWQDVRYALRLLRRSPLFTLLTIVVLSGGLGLSIFTFSFLHTAMLRPLPLGGGDRIVRVQQANGNGAFDAHDLERMRSGITTLSGVGAYASRELVIGDDSRQRLLHATAAEWNIFEVTRTPAALGRGFRPDDERTGAEPVIVLGHRAWQVSFGGDSSIVGRSIVVNGAHARVIGVMPEGYGFPVASDAWVPLGASALHTPTAGAISLDVYARLARGASASAAASELSTLLARARASRTLPDDEAKTPARVLVQSFQMAQVGEEGPMMLAVLNLLAGLVLLLACINVTNLLLARANERARETAVRLALGASRGRLVVQSLWESVLLCVGGGVLATGLAAWGLRAIDGWARSHLAGNLAFWWVWAPDRTTVLAAGVFVTITLGVLGAAVSARAMSTRFNAVLNDGGVRSGGRREGRVARVLVATQVATVSVLMFFGVMSGLVASRIANVSVGFDTRDKLTSTVALPADRYTTREKRSAFLETLRDALATSPSIEGAVLRSALADIGDADGEFVVSSAGIAAPSVKPHAYVQGVLGSLNTIGAPVREGRALDERDREGRDRVAVVSQVLAARYWPGASAVGQRIRLTGIGEKEQERTVVGVVRDVPLGNPISRDRSAVAIYVPLTQTDASSAQLVFEHRGDAVAAHVALRQALTSADPLLVAEPVQTLDEVIDKLALVARSVTKLFVFCFGFALLLAVSGTYGLMARSIGQRTREIGVRRALGATNASITQLLLGQGGRQLGIGAVVALPVMLLVGVGFSHYFPIALALSVTICALVSLTIVGVVLAATYLPTRKVLSVEVREALWRD